MAELFYWTGALVWAVFGALGIAYGLLVLIGLAIDLAGNRLFVTKEFWAFVRDRLERGREP